MICDNCDTLYPLNYSTAAFNIQILWSHRDLLTPTDVATTTLSPPFGASPQSSAILTDATGTSAAKQSNVTTPSPIHRLSGQRIEHGASTKGADTDAVTAILTSDRQLTTPPLLSCANADLIRLSFQPLTLSQSIKSAK